MKQANLVIGIIAIVGMFIGFIPCLGWFNWFNIPLAIVGIILGALAYNDERNDYYNNPISMSGKSPETPIGLILCCVAFVLGGIRLIVGFGIF